MVLCDRRSGNPSERSAATLCRETDDLVDRSVVIEHMVASSIISIADKTDVLRKGITVTVQDNPARSGGDISHGLRGTELLKVVRRRVNGATET